MDDDERKALDGAVKALQKHGHEAACYLKSRAEEEGNEEALDWLEDLPNLTA